MPVTKVRALQWAKGAFPTGEYQNKIALIHDGIDVDTAVPNPRATFTLPSGWVLHKDMEIVTFTARNLEPYRGFHVFMRAVEHICRRRPNCHVVISGGDDVSYSARLADHQTYREKMLSEVSIDPNRVHFLGFCRMPITSACYKYRPPTSTSPCPLYYPGP
jgi:glycosyltransferase involved in cell wall biosynthesis